MIGCADERRVIEARHLGQAYASVVCSGSSSAGRFIGEATMVTPPSHAVPNTSGPPVHAS